MPDNRWKEVTVANAETFKQHRGHKVAIVHYGPFKDQPDNIALECHTCNEILADWEARRPYAAPPKPRAVSYDEL